MKNPESNHRESSYREALVSAEDKSRAIPWCGFESPNAPQKTARTRFLFPIFCGSLETPSASIHCPKSEFDFATPRRLHSSTMMK